MRNANTPGDQRSKYSPAEESRSATTRLTVTPTSWAITDPAADIDYSERPGLNTELWACRHPGSPLVHARTRVHDAINTRSSRPVEIKGCRRWNTAADAHGCWQLRRPQHGALRRQDGYHLFVVYDPVPATRGVRAEIAHAFSATPHEVEARLGGALAWRTSRHESLDHVGLTAVPWPDLVTDATQVADLFRRRGEPAGIQVPSGRR